MHTKTSATVLNAAERRTEALRLRKEGLTFEEIGRQLGVNKSTAYNHVTEALKELRQDATENAEQVKAIELERLDTIYRNGFSALINGDLKGGDLCLRAMDRRARLLGLDAATKTEISGMLLASAEWTAIKGVILEVLAQSPELKDEFLQRLEELDV